MRRTQQGFLLLPVLLLLSMVTAAVYMTQREAQLSLLGQQTQSDSDKARAAAEAGLHRVVFETHRLGCGGDYPRQSTPVTDKDFNGASYEAYASRRDNSPITLSATGRYGDAQVTLTRSNVVMHSATPQIMVLQPDATGQDTHLRRGLISPDPDAPALKVQPDVSEALLLFDLRAIPQGSHVTAAQLTLRLTDLQGSGTIQLHRVQSAWTELATSASRNDSADGSAPWVQSPGDAHPSVVASSHTQGMDWMRWSITDLVDGWVKGRWPNYGLLLRANTLQSLSFASSDYPVPALRPRLIVSFLPPCNWQLPKQQQHWVPMADATLSEMTPQLNAGFSDMLKIQNNGQDSHVVMQFDTSTIAKDKTIKNATLFLTLTGLSGNTPTTSAIDIFARPNNESWEEASVTWTARNTVNDWNIAGGLLNLRDIRNSRTIVLPKGSTTGNMVIFDAKAWVNSWITSSASNFGVMVRFFNTESTALTFGSRESLTAPPVLFVEYE